MNDNPALPRLAFLDYSPYGAYAVDLTKTIRYWNRSAERITGHKADNVTGRPCFEVVQNCSPEDGGPLCRNGCPALQSIRENRISPVCEVSMVCATGQRKLVTLMPMLVYEPLVPEAVLVHLFHELDEGECTEQGTKAIAQTFATSGSFPETIDKLTSRELDVLKLAALGMTPMEISETLHISYHTVRKHTSNMRWKIGARNNLGLVRRAQELGLV